MKTSKGKPESLVLGRGTAQHRLGNSTQDVDFFWAELRTVEQLIEARHQFFRCRRVQKPHMLQRLLPMPQHPSHLLGISPLHVRNRQRISKPTQRLAPFIGHQLNGSPQVQRAKLWIARNTQRHIAAVHILIGHAKTLTAKQQAHTALTRPTSQG